MILNMFEQDIPIETIAVVASLSINEVKQIHDLIHYV